MRLIVAIWLFSLGCLRAHGQQLFVQRYSKDDIQGGWQNWRFAQDMQGVMYVANNDGVLRFNGQKWDLLDVPGQHYAFSMAFDSRDRLYVGSFNELGYFEKDENGKYKYRSLMPRLPDSLRDVKNVWQTFIFDDTVFFNGPGHIYIYAGGRFTVLTTSGSLTWFRKRPWLQTDSGLCAYNGFGFGPPRALAQLNGVHIRMIKDFIGNSLLLEDEKFRLWLFDPDAGSGGELAPFSPKLEGYLNGSPVRSFLHLENGTIALLLEKGLLFIDEQGNPVNFIPKTVFGTDITHGRMFEDNHHNLWLTATDTYIFQIITSSPLSFFDKNDGLDGTIISLGRHGDWRYVGTTKGLFVQGKDQEFRLVPQTEGETWGFYDFGGRFYAAHETGVFELEGTKAKKLIDQVSVHSLCEWKGRPGMLLMGTYNEGLWLLENNNKGWSKKRIKGFEAEIRFLTADDQGNLWTGNLATGIYRLRLTEGQDSVISQELYDERKGLPGKMNNRMCRLADGKLVAVTTDGIYGYDQSKDRFVPVPFFRQYLPAGWSVNVMAESPDGDIYFSGGTVKYREMAGYLHRQPDGSIRFFESPFHKIALSANTLRPERLEEEHPLMIAGPDEMWLGDNEKLVSYDATKKTYYDDSLPVYPDKVLAGDSLILNGDRSGFPVREMAYSRNKLRFSFFTPYFESSEKLEYQYKLDGFDNKWSPWTQDNEAAFINLSEGDYVLWARVRNIYGKIGESVAIPFRIRPPWWRTWWAYLFAAMVLLALVLVGIRLYTRAIAAKNRSLERKVAEKTKEITESAQKLKELNASKDRLFSIISHDLRGPMGTMKAVVDLMKNSAMSEQDVRSFGTELGDHLLVTGHLLNNLLTWSKAQMEGMPSTQKLFALQEVVDETCQLFNYMSASREIRLVTHIAVGLQVYGDEDIVRTVLRNLVNNAIKFTPRNGEVTIGAAKNGKSLEVFVKDTGPGISQDGISRILGKQSFHKRDATGQVGAGLGLLLCQEMLEKEGGCIAIESSEGEGSRFSIFLPLQ
jgi:signal transduction histidine kinase/ligand-binding sensor domain-containing protein